ncbi:YopX family protein [Leuconostoc fallax]|uniref:YopX family protein n=1 Tax=Leuconostoc fallax TaxID=1251 RepID=UPI0020A82184|nr:YopX family protein [Leuconostoc fallax]
MREIKFRAWNNVNARYYQNAQDTYDETIGDGFQDILRNENLVVEQFTALKDKNGVDIYEGDIVFAKSIMMKDSTGPVVYVKESAGFYIDGSKDLMDIPKPLGVTREPLFSYEVLGNVHENPELLQE